LLSVEQALEKILGYVDVLEAEQRLILDCLGQVLAEDVYSTINIPPTPVAPLSRLLGCYVLLIM